MTKPIIKGEFAFIDWIRANSGARPDYVTVGSGDDCAVIKTPTNSSVVVTTDSVIEGVHFTKGTPPRLVGMKAMARSLSDIAAMGVKPYFCVAAVALPEDFPLSSAKDIYTGMREIADIFKVPIVGGDVSNSAHGDIMINVTSTGVASASGKHARGLLNPVLRSGAMNGDIILVTGTLGGSILHKHLNFLPCINEGMELNSRFHLNSMIDISDGLAKDLGHILAESGRRGAILYSDALPLSADARKLARKTGRPAYEHALGDGEDYELLFTVGQKEAERILQWAQGRFLVTLIGVVDDSRKGLFLNIDRGRAEMKIDMIGFEHGLK